MINSLHEHANVAAASRSLLGEQEALPAAHAEFLEGLTGIHLGRADESTKTSSALDVYFAVESLTSRNASAYRRGYSQVTLFMPVRRNATQILMNDFLMTFLLSSSSFSVLFLSDSIVEKVTLLFTLIIALSGVDTPAARR